MYTNYPGKSIDYISTHYENFKMITDIECNELILKAQQGDLNSQSKVIESVMAFIFKAAKDLWKPGSEIDDLIQIGVLGCIKAIHSFDVSKGYTFLTFAGPVIFNEIRKYLRGFGPAKRPVYLEDVVYRDTSKHRDILLKDMVEDSSSSSFVEMIEDSEVLQLALSEISKFSDNQRLIIECYFGLNGRTAMSQVELSNYVGISQPHISRIIARCIRDIRKNIDI